MMIRLLFRAYISVVVLGSIALNESQNLVEEHLKLLFIGAFSYISAVLTYTLLKEKLARCTSRLIGQDLFESVITKTIMLSIYSLFLFWFFEIRGYEYKKQVDIDSIIIFLGFLITIIGYYTSRKYGVKSA